MIGGMGTTGTISHNEIGKLSLLGASLYSPLLHTSPSSGKLLFFFTYPTPLSFLRLHDSQAGVVSILDRLTAVLLITKVAAMVWP
jgi:hypothetical protein